MFRYFQRGLQLLASAALIIVPVLVFLTLDYLTQGHSGALNINAPLLPQLSTLLTTPVVIIAAGASFLAKTLSVLFSNADMFLALKNQPNRYARIFSTFGLADWAGLLLIAFLWNALFALIAIVVVWAGDAVLTQRTTLIVAGVVGALLFPIYYAGMSLGTLTFVVRKLEGRSLPALFDRIWQSRTRVYFYYAIRSFLDATVFVGVPLLWLNLTHSTIVGAIGTLITVGVFVAYIRASFMVFKSELLIGPNESNTQSSATDVRLR